MTGEEQYSRPKTLTLIHSQTEDRLRHARGPVLRHFCYIYRVNTLLKLPKIFPPGSPRKFRGCLSEKYCIFEILNAVIMQAGFQEIDK